MPWVLQLNSTQGYRFGIVCISPSSVIIEWSCMAQFDVVRVFLFVVSARNGFGYVFFEHALPRTGLRVRNSKAFWMRSLLLSVRRLDSAWCHHFVLLCFGKSVWIGSLEHLQGCRQGLHMIPCVTRAFFVEVLC